MSEVRKLRITGGEDVLLGRTKSRKRRITTRKVGGAGSDATGAPISAINAGAAPATPVATVTSVASIADKVSPSQVASNVATSFVPKIQPTTVGGGVNLVPKKKRVILDKSHTRKASVSHVRKIQLGVNGLHKVIHRAKTIKKKSKDIPIEQVKKELVKHGLCKAGSKAPESMLRQTYADFLTLREKAL